MDIIKENLVCLNLDAKDKYEAIKNLSILINDDNRLSDHQAYIDSVLEREELTSTGIGNGIAIPHGKCKDVKTTTVAFGRIDEGIEWESLDGGNVRLVILLAIPENCSGNEHLRILASLSRKLIHEDFREELYSLQEPKEVLKLLSECLS